jgi:hypothetical protein
MEQRQFEELIKEIETADIDRLLAISDEIDNSIKRHITQRELHTIRRNTYQRVNSQ